jgi:hypothetical protein
MARFTSPTVSSSSAITRTSGLRRARSGSAKVSYPFVTRIEPGGESAFMVSAIREYGTQYSLFRNPVRAK